MAFHGTEKMKRIVQMSLIHASGNITAILSMESNLSRPSVLHLTEKEKIFSKLNKHCPIFGTENASYILADQLLK